MTLLLMLGWPWFAGALALGALVGFLTFSRDRNAGFSGGWIVVLGAVALAIGYAASLAELLSGREATTLDIAVLAGLAYAAGLPLGGWLKSLGAGAEKERPEPPQIIVARAPALAATGQDILEALEPLVDHAAEPILLDATPPGAGVLSNGHAREAEAPMTIVAPAAHVENAPAPPPGRAPRAAPGLKPETLAGPRLGVPDDLARIKGIGPKSLEKLNALGVFHYDQIASWNLDNAKWVGATIGAPGRVERDKWIQQARALAGAGVGEQ